MSTILKIITIFILSINCLHAQCDLKVNKADGAKKSENGKHVTTYSELLYNKGNAAEWKVIYGSVSNFYDGTPQFKLKVCLADDHFSIKKEHDVIFHIKNSESIRKKNFLRTGAKTSKIGSGTTHCAIYTVPIDDELKAIFLDDQKKCILENLEVTHSRGSEEFKIKAKYSNILGDLVKCAIEAMEN